MSWQQQLHPRGIDLGLERIRRVFDSMELRAQVPKVLTVAGTNGKGTCVEAAQALALAAGKRVGSYTSPHLWRYNERIRIDGQSVTDARIVAAFERIEERRGAQSLTYFEFATLAAFEIFAQENLDLWILEVGLGGRLDAVNLIDADVAVVTSIGLDHQDWLGSDLEKIADEKLAIGRSGQHLFAGRSVPAAACQRARSVGVDVRSLAENRLETSDCPPALVRENLELACQALDALDMLPPAPGAILRTLQVPGRCERHVFAQHEEIYDVAHNADAIAHLLEFLGGLPAAGSTVAVFSALADKPIEEMSAMLDGAVDAWCLVGLNEPRGLTVGALQQRIRSEKPVHAFESFGGALEAARAMGRRIVVCGSFHTVSAGKPRHG